MSSGLVTVFVWVCLVLAAAAQSDPAAVLESQFSARDIPLDPDPQREEWSDAPRVLARVDRAGQPIDTRPPEKGRELRIGLFRISGANPRQHHTWRATDGITFHVPKAFGTLRLR